MVQPGYRPPASRPNPATGTGGPEKYSGCAVIALIALAIFGISKCVPTFAPTTDNIAATATTNAQQAISASITSQTVPPVIPFSKSSATKGVARQKLAFSKEGLAGEMIFSQNCYDALSHAFAWHKLDECGAADLAAVGALGDADTTDDDKEAAWFESEAAAGRYLRAATAAGLDADTADARLSKLQETVRRTSPRAKETASSGALDNILEPAGAGNAADGDE